MRLLTQRSSSFYKQGDYAACHLLDAERYTDIIIQRDDEKDGMLGILEFVEAI